MPFLGTFGGASMGNWGNQKVSAINTGYLTTGLVVNLDATNSSSFGSSGTVWTDLTGYANATFLNGTTKSTAGGGSVIFSNSNYATFPTAIFAGRSEFTIELWVNITAGTSSLTFYSEEQNLYWLNTIQMGGWYTRTSATGPTGTRTNDMSLSGVSIPTVTWVHLCFVYSVNGGFKRFYLNGTLTQTVNNVTYPLVTATSTCRLGSSADGVAFSGLMRQVRMYHVALTQEQVTSNYQNTFPG